MSKAEAASASTSPLRVFHRLDDGVFAAERMLIAVSLVAMTLMVFLDVVYRQLIAPTSALDRWLALVIDDEGTRAAAAPWVAAVLAALILTGAYATAERQRGSRVLPFPGSAAVLGVVTTAALAGISVLMVQASSQIVYLGLLAIATTALIAGEVQRKEEGWIGRVVTTLLVAAPTALVIAGDAFPRGYTWSKEIAMTVTLWVGFFGASLCVHEGKHIRLEALESAHPDRAKRLIAALAHVVAAGFCTLLAYLGWQYTFSPEGGTYSFGGALPLSGVPTWIRTAAIPLLFAISSLRFFGAAISALLGGTYGAPAKAEGMEEAEKLAAQGTAGEDDSAARSVPPSTGKRSAKRGVPLPFAIVLGLIVLLPLLGKGGVFAAVILAGMLLAEPLFVVLGLMTVVAFVLWGGRDEVSDFSILVERIVSVADNEALLAIPFFILSGAIMARGEISARLLGFARALVGWMPGGMAISAVVGCMIFAAISGSSPATVVAIGGMMGPALIKQGYKPAFAHGLVTSAGSLGILIPPSIPMIVYAIVNTTSPIRVEELFAAGFGPGFVIGGILMTYSLYRGVVDKAPRDPFSLARLATATRDGVWSLSFPLLILGGIYSGVFNAVESACISVVYAVVVEVWIHRAMKLADLPKVFAETSIMLGSFLVILVVAMSFVEFLEYQSIPAGAADWIRSLDLDRVMFLVVLNLALLVVGCLMDIMSAIFVCVPLIAPMANALGIDPLHLGIIFIVNLEIGYLTPPVGLNLFVASTLFDKPLTYLIRAVAPFIAMMFVGLMVITYVPAVSVDLGRWIAGTTPPAPPPRAPAAPDAPAHACEPPEDLNCDGVVSIEEMTEYAEQQAAQEAAAQCDPPEDLNCDGAVSIEEMTEYSERQGALEALPQPEAQQPEAQQPEAPAP